MADMSTMAKEKAQELGNKAQEMGNSCAQAASNAADGIRSAVGHVADQARDAAAAASRQAGQAGSFLDRKAEDAASALGGGLKAAGEAIRSNAPQEGTFGQASSRVAQSLTDTGDYIQRQGLEGIGGDITNMIKRNPIPALIMGIGLGFLVARASAPRS